MSKLKKSKQNPIYIISISITIISLLVAVIAKSDVALTLIWPNNSCIPAVSEILYDIAVGIFSAMILFWLIDRTIENRNNKEEARRINLVVLDIIKYVNS